ncbi:MAG: hypothetical protein AB1668_05360 [Nanoarchaeota archaeon]
MEEISNLKKLLQEHFNSINDNTAEIQSLFDYIQELEIKIDKLAQRLDKVQLTQGSPITRPSVFSLSQTEKKIFLVLYTEEIPLSCQEIAIKASLPLTIIPECISSLIGKGIPFQRSFFNNQLFFRLDPQFKEKQAKENIVNLSLQSFIE